ncbi:MAG: hypothetical protein LIP12_16605 [Clostridiales bacterium]|nr:hypothetical protein [Clostridiales bacterium]
MRIEDFNTITQEQVERCLTVLAEKGKEYSLTDDRLDHFKTAAAEQEVTPKQALWGMASKHIASLSGMCKSGQGDMDRWLEKITDSINYLLLLRALVEEEMKDGQN